jgi:hypothetical protein
LKSGREMSVQEAEKKIRSAIIIQQSIRTLHQHHCINHQQQECYIFETFKYNKVNLHYLLTFIIMMQHVNISIRKLNAINSIAMNQA